MGKLDGKTALITGSGSGIGRATALLFAREGARVAVVDHVPSGAQETVRTIKEAGGSAIFLECNVCQSVDVERMVKATVDAYGRIDILHNNAGIQGPVAPVADLTEDGWDLVINTNLKSVFLGSKYAIPIMVKQGGGVIINTSSAMGLCGRANIAAYCVSKGGIILLTKTMAAEYSKQNIRVNCICPGVIETPMAESSIAALQMQYIPQGKAGRAEDIARAALFLASDDSAYVTGASLVVDGGWTAELILPFKKPRV